MSRIHGGLTVIDAIKEGDRKELSTRLKLLHNAGGDSPFALSQSTLFAAGVILPQEDYNGIKGALPESLVFATTYCGPLSEHLDDLWNTNSTNLCGLFSLCKDFPAAPDREKFIAYLKKHNHTGTFSSSFNLMTREDVRLEKGLREIIETYIDKAQKLCAFDNLCPVEVKTLITRHLRSSGDEFAWAFKPVRKTIREWLQTAWVSLLPIALILILPWLITTKQIFWIVLIVAASLVVLLVLILFLINLVKTPAAARPPDDWVRSVSATQLNPVINGMTASAPLKKGMLRRIFYSLALKIIGSFSQITVRVPTVSSIRWLSVDKGRRLLFLSNYSNTTDFYVRDFLVGKTPRGVNFMFSNGTGFPDAGLSFIGGIRKDPEGYMNAVHSGQNVMDLWYTHEGLLTVDMINRNRAIRNGLPKKMNADEARQWLRLL